MRPMPTTFPFVEKDGMLTPKSKEFVLEIYNESTIIGTGSPEGVLEAVKGREYMDDSGTTGSIKWIKKTNDISGDRTKGWVLI